MNVVFLKRFFTWAGIIILVLYLGLVIYRIPAVLEKQKTEETVTRIHAARLTLADVMGENLPPPPDPVLKDATIQGIDANGNGIRDDVELAIFEKYPDSARVRAALLQYAKALQMELVEVFNSETLVAAIQEEERADFCIAETAPQLSSSSSAEDMRKVFALTDQRSREVGDLVLNTAERKQRYEEIFQHMTSYGSLEEKSCDIFTDF